MKISFLRHAERVYLTLCLLVPHVSASINVSSIKSINTCVLKQSRSQSLLGPVDSEHKGLVNQTPDW